MTEEAFETHVEYVGPFEGWQVVVDGWCRVSLLEAHPLEGGGVSLILDSRFGLELSVADAERFLPFLAHAVAIASGFACHPSQNGNLVALSVVLPRRFPALSKPASPETVEVVVLDRVC